MNILNVMSACRERNHMTVKMIQSIHENSTCFDKINIYIYDNFSDFSTERMEIIQKLLKDKMICYYSYNQEETCCNIMSKAMLFQTWAKMMVDQYNLFDECKTNTLIPKTYKGNNNYYMLCDNDMLFGPTWDEHFLSALHNVPNTTHYLVKYPGGMGAGDNSIIESMVPNKFKPGETIKVKDDVRGGSSGVWFMDYNMLKKNIWSNLELMCLFGRTHGDDVMSWRIIDQRYKRVVYYVRRVCPSSTDNPLILHLGGVVGSIINHQKKTKYTDTVQQQNYEEDKKLKDITVSELFDRFKNTGGNW